ncbi:MAG: hypothetical protein GY703_20455 [Gammaproteobacteria bacterium]|nr:hypothetical protein [Gammaproteobacteria bacterium]
MQYLENTEVLFVSCSKLRIAVVISAASFLLGILLQVPTLFPGLFPGLVPVVLSYGGFLAMLFSFILMSLLAVVVLIPRVSTGLKPCQH